jgi:surface carbohydrate biosynthesis protein
LKGYFLESHQDLSLVMNVAPIAYLLCEFKNRDLPSRLLIADYLLAAGYRVVIGQFWGIQRAIGSPCLPPGVCLYATANPVQVGGMKQSRKAGFIVTATDEEALPLADAWMLSNVAPDALEACDLFFANSDHHKSVLGSAGNIRVTGNARIERISKQTHARPIPEDYILFNTGFGLINSVWGNTEEACRRLAKAAGMDLKSPDKAPANYAELNKRIAAESAALHLTMHVIKWVTENVPLRVVIRPHPSENAAEWEALAEKNERISVVPRSDPLPWIAHARLLLHSDSTTGIEAAAFGTPAINIAPDAEWSNRFILSHINQTVRNLSEAATVIAAAVGGGGKAIQPALLTTGAQQIAAALAECLPPPASLHPSLRVHPWDLSPPRTQAQKDKFTATESDIGRPCTELCESVFLLLPSGSHVTNTGYEV